MFVIGVTGSLGTGKTTVAKMFHEFGARMINADRIVHQLLKPGGKCHGPVLRLLGPGVLTAGRLNRKKIAKVVFKNRSKLKKLEKIIHPAVVQETKRRLIKIGKLRNVRVVMDVPLLFESGMDPLADVTVTVKTKRKTQIDRAVKSLNISRKEALRRISAQWPLSRKAGRSDYIINNDGTRRQTRKQVKALWQKI